MHVINTCLLHVNLIVPSHTYQVLQKNIQNQNICNVGPFDIIVFLVYHSIELVIHDLTKLAFVEVQ